MKFLISCLWPKIVISDILCETIPTIYWWRSRSQWIRIVVIFIRHSKKEIKKFCVTHGFHAKIRLAFENHLAFGFESSRSSDTCCCSVLTSIVRDKRKTYKPLSALQIPDTLYVILFPNKKWFRKNIDGDIDTT